MKKSNALRLSAAARCARTLALAFAITSAGAVAQAAESAPSAERIKSAAAEYDAGRRAFTDGKFEEAAVHFENAFHDAPNAQTLRNAMRARLKASHLARAGTLAALAESKYAGDSATASAVKETLAAVEGRMQRVTISCDPACGIALDGRVASVEDASRLTLFFEPGAHALVVSWPGERSKTLSIDAKAGAAQDFTLSAPPMPVVSVTPAVRLAPGPAAVPPPEKPLGRAPFLVSAGLTVVSAGALVWSGLDTLSNPGVDAVRQGCANQGEACALYQQGLSAQRRTNILIGVTAGLGVATGVIGLFLTQWTSAPRSEVTVSPSVALVSGGGAGVLSGTF